jgi:hypothetical protein
VSPSQALCPLWTIMIASVGCRWIFLRSEGEIRIQLSGLKSICLEENNVGQKTNSENAGVTTSRIAFCDLRCGSAGFAKANALDGSCRTFQSLWCEKLKRHVTKNAPCEALYGRRRPTTGL